MASCDDRHRSLLRLADGTLPAPEQAALERHLTACAGCRAALDAQREVAARLAGRPARRPSAAFAQRLSARLDAESGFFGLADWRQWTLRLAPVAAALAVTAWLTAAPASPQPTLEDWTVAGVVASSTAGRIRDGAVTSDALLSQMLGHPDAGLMEDDGDVR